VRGHPALNPCQQLLSQLLQLCLLAWCSGDCAIDAGIDAELC
jgi:hypothetical protein